jgi:hypothetical protein
MTTTIEGLSVRDSKLAREVTELIRGTESPLLFNHSSRVYYFGALAGIKMTPAQFILGGRSFGVIFQVPRPEM